MKYIRPDGRVLADIGEKRKQNLYKKLLDLKLTFKDWLKETIDNFLKESEGK